MFQEAVYSEVIAFNPVSKIKSPKIKKTEAKFYDEEQVLKVIKLLNLLDEESFKWKVIIYVALFTGMRLGEVMGLEWKDFDFEKGLAALAGLNSGKFIYHAGLEWKIFDYNAGLDALLKICDPKYIFYAGAYWKRFDFFRGGEGLLKSGDCQYLYRAGAMWASFDYAQAWEILESKVEAGETWRGLAFENTRWRKALAEIWRTID